MQYQKLAGPADHSLREDRARCLVRYRKGHFRSGASVRTEDGYLNSVALGRVTRAITTDRTRSTRFKRKERGESTDALNGLSKQEYENSKQSNRTATDMSKGIVNFLINGKVVKHQQQSAEDFIYSKLKPAGSGLYRSLMSLIGGLAFKFNLTDHEILDILLQKVIDYGRSEWVARDEITKTIASVRCSSSVPYSGTEERTKWPEPDLDEISAIVNKELTAISGNSPLAYLRKLSPIKGATANQIIDVLFPGDPLLCAGETPKRFRTKRKNAHGDFGEYSFVVPSPMSSIKGLTQRGSYSDRSLNNVGPHRFLPLEFDICEFERNGKTHKPFAPLVREWRSRGISPKQAQAALILHLMRNREPVLVVDSGGKSLHVWFFCEGNPEPEITEYVKRAVIIGVDHVTDSKAQLVRMPEGTRDSGERQEAIYYNPLALRIYAN